MEVDPDLPRLLLLDQSRLRQILLNLVGNAVKFTHKGYVKLSARSIPRSEDGSELDLLVSVEDTGVGIPEDELGSVFGAFEQQRAHEGGEAGGTGLGLAVSKRLAEMQNGRIDVRSQVGKGSVFELILRDVHVPSLQEPAPEEEPFDVASVSFERRTVLIVDDVESNRLLLQEFLEKVNLASLTVNNGQEALSIALERQPDLILMDIRMPGMSGVEATRRLKADPKTEKIPVIALTASSRPEHKQDLDRVGFSGYMDKPVALRLLLDEIARHLPLETTAAPDAEPGEEAAAPRDEVERPEELAEALERAALPIWENLSDVVDTQELGRFCECLERLGEEHGARSLVVYSRQLLGFADAFDMGSMQASLRRFPRMLDELKGTGGDDE